MPVIGFVIVLSTLWFLFAATAWSGRQMRPETTGVLLYIAMLCLRPGLIGETTGPLGAALLIAALTLVLRTEIRAAGRPPGHQSLALLSCMVLPILLTGLVTVETLSGLLVAPLVAAGGWAAGQDARILRGLCGTTAVVAAHQSLSLVISQWLSLGSTTFSPTGTSRTGWRYVISAGGSISVGSGGVLKLFEQRLTGPYGEPGVFAGVLAITAILDLVMNRSWRWKIQVPMVCAIVLTQSIAGMGIYVSGLLVFVVVTTRRRRGHKFRLRHHVLIAVGFVLSLVAATNRNGVLAGKQSANAESVSDRLGSVSPSQLLGKWLAHPLGIHSSSSINLVQSSIAYGPLILLLGFWLYLAPLMGRKSWDVAPLVATILLTVLFSQPPMLYSWVFFAFIASGIGKTQPSGQGVKTGATTQVLDESSRSCAINPSSDRPAWPPKTGSH